MNEQNKKQKFESILFLLHCIYRRSIGGERGSSRGQQAASNDDVIVCESYYGRKENENRLSSGKFIQMLTKSIDSTIKSANFGADICMIIAVLSFIYIEYDLFSHHRNGDDLRATAPDCRVLAIDAESSVTVNYGMDSTAGVVSFAIFNFGAIGTSIYRSQFEFIVWLNSNWLFYFFFWLRW